MSKYRVKVRSFINGRLHEPGDEVEFAGNAGSNLASIDEPVAISTNINVEAETELVELRLIYEEMFGEAAHFNVKAETLKSKIAAKRAELGV